MLNFAVAFLLSLFVVSLNASEANSLDPTGQKDSTAALRALFEALPSQGGKVMIPEGKYKVSGSILIPSDTTVLCKGAHLLASSSWPKDQAADPPLPVYQIFANKHFSAMKITDHDITIDGCNFDYSALNRGDVHAVSMRMAKNIVIKNVRCQFGGDCTAMLATDNTLIEDSVATEQINVCWDHWEHPTNVVVRRTRCATNSDHCGSGIMITGGARKRDGLALNGTIQDNIIEGKGPAFGCWASGIQINGLFAQHAGGSSINVTKNIIKFDYPKAKGTVSIRVAGQSADNTISNNIIEGGTGPAVQVYGGDAGGKPTGTKIFGNQISQIKIASGFAPIDIDGDGTIIKDNSIRGGNYPVGILVRSRGVEVGTNTIEPGKFGRIKNDTKKPLSDQ